MSDDDKYMEIDPRLADVLLLFLCQRGVPPQEAFGTLLYAARKLAEFNHVPEHVMIKQFRSIEIREDGLN